MIVSWKWLAEYVPLNMTREKLEHELMMSGLNHEGTEEIDDDWAIDLEVTSNRPDCLGHLGVARETAALFDEPLSIPEITLNENGPAIAAETSVEIECPDLCYRYTARLIRGVKIGPSPEWMQKRLLTLGITPINNIVDISNYVMMENGQPLHAFDFGKLADGRIVVRRPKKGEKIEAIDHKTYELSDDMCLICDGTSPVAIGGVMGGAGTEISESTVDVLVEAADFDPISVRTTARALSLHSDSSFRFERRVDPEGIDWASRRCCQLILELAGGKLCKGVIDIGPAQPPREPIVFRLSQIPRILGIDVSADRVCEILESLGITVTGRTEKEITAVPPTWRRDLTREIDLVEEVARIFGYDKIPEDVGVRMAASARRQQDRVIEKVRIAMTAAGIDEAMTYSAVTAEDAELPSPWTKAEPLQSIAPILRGADRLRTTLVPSLLAARRHNETLANPRIELFETAKIYLPQDDKLPAEPVMLTVTSGRPYRELLGIIERLVALVAPSSRLDAAAADWSLLDPAESCRLMLAGGLLGFVGRPTAETSDRFGLRTPTVVAEIDLDLLCRHAELIARTKPLSQFPPMSRDLNLEVSDTVHWADIAQTVHRECGELFESLEYLDTYRDKKRLGKGKKRILLSFTLRSATDTMTGTEADEIRDRVVAACEKEHGAVLR